MLVSEYILRIQTSFVHIQKLQFVKAEAQKEINSLKSKIAELERKLALQQMPATKRKMF